MAYESSQPDRKDVREGMLAIARNKPCLDLITGFWTTPRLNAVRRMYASVIIHIQDIRLHVTFRRHYVLKASSRSSTDCSSLISMVVRFGYMSVGVLCAVTLAG